MSRPTPMVGPDRRSMMRHEDSREHIERALIELGWDVHSTGEDSAIMGGYGKYHLMVSFEQGEPSSVLISYVGKGGEILSRKWPGAERLPTPEKVVQVFS